MSDQDHGVSPDVISYVVAAIGVAIAALRELLSRRTSTVKELQARVDHLEDQANRMWLICRDLVDYAYRHGDGTPLPESTKELFKEQA